MYIAFKWLLFLSLVMWGLLCCFDLYLLRAWIDNKGNNIVKLGYTYENITTSPNEPPFKILKRKYGQRGGHDISIIKYSAFIFASILILFYNKNQQIVSYVKALIIKMELHEKVLSKFKYRDKFDIMTFYNKIKNECYKYVIIMWQYIGSINLSCLEAIVSETNVIEEHEIESEILIKKLKEVNEDRKNLSHLFMSAIEDNKNTRMKLQLESMAKDRLLKHIEDINRQIKENKTKYFSFQHLYLVTHQENIFLKARIKKLSKDKNEAEQNLLNLLQKVYESKHSGLRAYCSRFIVGSKDNLLNSNVYSEIHNFLRKSKKPLLAATRWDENCDADVKKCVVTELAESDVLDIINDAVHSGITTEFSEHAGDSNRQMSDRDNFNDLLCKIAAESKTSTDYVMNSIDNKDIIIKGSYLYETNNLVVQSNLQKKEYSTANQNFVTGSQAFKNFLKRSGNVNASARSPTSLCQ